MSIRLADAIFWVAVACCLVAQVAVVRSVVISSARVAEPVARASAGRRVAEIAWAVLPGVALAVLFVFTWRAMHAAGPSAGILSGALS